MAGNAKVALEVAGTVALLGTVLGLLAWPFEPPTVSVYGAQVSRLVLAALIPACGLVCSLFLALFFQCDPHVASHSSDSRAAVGAAIVLPTATALVLHAIVLVAGMAKHKLTMGSVAFVCGFFLVGLGFVFHSIEQTYVVGIRNVWTLRSPQVWERTHEWASRLYVVSGLALVVLAFFLPAGFWSVFAIVALFVLPGLVSIGISYAIRDDQYTYIVR